MVHGVTRFVERHAPRIFVGVVDAGLFTQSQLARVADHLVKTNLAADVLEVRVVRVSKSVRQVNSIVTAIADGLDRLDHLLFDTGDAGNQLDSRTWVESAAQSPILLQHGI